jgi:hypothetical protein
MADLQTRFDNWNATNPEFYKLFEHFTLEAVGAGRIKLSAWLIANRIRWEETLSTTGEGHKVPNDFIALFARKFMAENSWLDGLFETRPMVRA